MNMLKQRFSAFVIGLFTVVPCVGYASPGQLSDTPLYLASVVEPNILFIKDDSGSMQFEVIPDGIAGDTDYLFPPVSNMYGGGTYSSYIPHFSNSLAINLEGRSYVGNPMFYDPLITYEPWYNADRSQWSDVDATKAPINPGRSASGTLDLTSAHWHRNWRTGNGTFQDWRQYYPMTFYVLLDANGDLTAEASSGTYWRVQVRGSSAFIQNIATGVERSVSAFNWSTEVSRTVTEEIQNFANWFSYHRSRTLAARAGIGDAFSRQPENIRVGYGSLNKGSSSIDGANTSVISRGVRGFSGTDREEFFELLYESDVPAAGTPLKGALAAAGEYYRRSSSRGPWGETPGTLSSADQLECRRAFTILMTDGYYSDSVSGYGNQDGTNGPTIGDFRYEAVSPFTDSRSNTLADVAMYYWKNDLRTDLSNRIRPTDSNPAFWQHMSTYGVGLGVTGSIDPGEAFGAIGGSDTITWPSTSTNDGKLDDLLHAAVNSRGGFFSAGNATDFARELGGVLFDILNVEGSSTGVTFNTATLETDTLLFGARFDSTDWTGDLFAFGLTDNPSGPPTVDEDESWLAASILSTRDLTTDPRNIITYNGSQGVAFAWSNLNTGQQDDLAFDGDTTLGQARLDYLRGVSVAGMRDRDGKLLGDIVNSTPVYVSAPSLVWPNAAPFGVAGNTYADFRAAHQSRAPVVYVGANDGKLHAFDAGDTNGGRELFAYIPEFLFSDQPEQGLHYLTDPDYKHRFYVDLSPVVSDVYTQGPTDTQRDWRTILVGGARAGGRGIFALDVTDPTSISENTADEVVMWEFTSEDDPRMGYLTEPPSIGLAQWGGQYRWTAFFGNGYNSPTPATGVFMLDIEGGLDGSWDTGDYQFVSFDSTSGATGLGPLRILDLNGDRVIDRVYGGDLNGKLWAVERKNSGSWATAYGNTNNPQPLFTANRSGSAQPITAAPMVIRNPDNLSTGDFPDLMVLFGTGQYLTNVDPSTTEIQSFYGVRDSGSANLDRSDLVDRTLTESTITVDGVSYEVRESDGDPLTDEDGWYVDFDTDPGERIVQSPRVRGQYIFVNSTIPSDDPCSVGGGGWLMAFGLDGQTPDRSVWPKLGDPVVGYKVNEGLPNPSSFLGDYMFTTLSSDKILADEIDVGDDDAALGRMSWQELYD